LRRAQGGANIFGVFRVKNHDFTPKNHIFSYFFGGGAPGAPPRPGSAPVLDFLTVPTVWYFLFVILILWKRYNLVVHKKNNEMFFYKPNKSE
jgi:hypothetical protein